MTGLLVSVRSAAEAEIALSAGVDVVDVKEPSRGSLGAASTEVIQNVVDLVAGRTMVSAACGELRDVERGMRLAICGLELAKVALAGCESIGDWRERWREWAASLPAGTEPVAVVYADRKFARSPRWEDVIALAAGSRAPYLLVDTFDKSAGTLFDHWSAAELQDCVGKVREAGLSLVLAGSLAGDAILRALEFQPDYIAVRGAACRGGRAGALDVAAIGGLLQMIGKRRGNSKQRSSGADPSRRTENRLANLAPVPSPQSSPQSSP